MAEMNDQHDDLLMQAVETVVARSYLSGADVRCSPIRSYTNDVYLAESGGRQLIVKLYRTSWRSDGELHYEVDLLEHLASKGVPVARAIPGNDGAWLHHVAALRGRRQMIAFEVAPGAKPTRPFTQDLYRRFGRAAARMHAALADFSSPQPRFRQDTRHLIEEPLRALRPFLTPRPDDWAFLADVAARVKADILTFAQDGLDWGVIHGDLTLDNLHVADDGQIVFYDFDDGGPGWRAHEFQGVYQAQRERANGVWDAYLEGYLAVRALSANDLRAIPSFVVADQVWSMGVDAERRLRPLPAEQADALLTRWMTRLRSLAATT